MAKPAFCNLICGSIDLNSKPMVALGKDGTSFLRVQGASGETGRKNPNLNQWTWWFKPVLLNVDEEGGMPFLQV